MNISYLNFFDTLDVIIPPVIITDANYLHLFRNRAFYEQIGYGSVEMYNSNAWLELVYPDPDYRKEILRQWNEQVVEAAQTGSSQIHLLSRVHCQNENYKWYDIHEHRLGDLKIITFLDVNRLQLQNEELLRVIKFNSLFNATLAHDIRSPLATLDLLLKFKNKFFPTNEEQLQSHFQRISRQLHRIFDVIDSAVLHQAAGSDHFQFTIRKIAIRNLLKHILTYYEEELIAMNITLDGNIESEIFIEYDAFILEVMLRNIISNAIKHSPRNATITITTIQSLHHIDLSVTDNGEGLTQEQIDHILEPRGGNLLPTRENFNDGFGLGLRMAKDLLENHYGKLLVESLPGIGSVFTIRLPGYIPKFPDY
ncbi:Signal transduction histidine kinase [bacterium A37T11]|nr:Signal transduction histidine kinase [bacterium A37T11]